MKILFIANERIPSEKANSINIVKMCSALASLGVEVTLVIPKRKNPQAGDVFAYYNVPRNFQIEFVPAPETLHLGKYGFLWNQCIFSLKIFFNTQWNKKDWVIFTRDIYTSLFLSWRGYRVFHDLHGFPESSHWFWKYVLKRMDGIICTNEWKMKQCMEKYWIALDKMMVARNGFDPKMFIDEAKNLGLGDNPIALYTGHFYDWKGAHVLAEAAQFMPEVTAVLLGGSEAEVMSFTKKYRMWHNVVIRPHRPQREVARFLAAADVLVLPNSRQSANPRLRVYSQFDTSPIKMFEYMASGKPIVAADLPSIREVLSEDTAVFFAADDPKSLANKIQFVLNHPEKVQPLVQLAREKVQEFTWEKRAKLVIDFIQKKL